MLNAIFVTAIYLLQQNKETVSRWEKSIIFKPTFKIHYFSKIFIRWPLDAKANLTIIQGSITVKFTFIFLSKKQVVKE